MKLLLLTVVALFIAKMNAGDPAGNFTCPDGYDPQINGDCIQSCTNAKNKSDVITYPIKLVKKDPTVSCGCMYQIFVYDENHTCRGYEVCPTCPAP